MANVEEGNLLLPFFLRIFFLLLIAFECWFQDGGSGHCFDSTAAMCLAEGRERNANLLATMWIVGFFVQLRTFSNLAITEVL